MSFKNPNQKYDKDPVVYHSELVKNGPKLVTIKSVPKVITRKSDQKRFHLVTIELNGVNHTYFIPNQDVAEGFKQNVGKSVVLIASGNDKQGTATMEFQAAMVPATQIPQPEQAAKVAPTKKEEVEKPAQPKDREAKMYLCQASNLMRLCVKKANDIAVELGLPNEHRQGIATTLFIQADRQGYIFNMPLQPYSPEELGWGASKAESLVEPQPNE
jgi:hypothetical protein